MSKRDASNSYYTPETRWLEHFKKTFPYWIYRPALHKYCSERAKADGVTKADVARGLDPAFFTGDSKKSADFLLKHRLVYSGSKKLAAIQALAKTGSDARSNDAKTQKSSRLAYRDCNGGRTCPPKRGRSSPGGEEKKGYEKVTRRDEGPRSWQGAFEAGKREEKRVFLIVERLANVLGLTSATDLIDYIEEKVNAFPFSDEEDEEGDEGGEIGSGRPLKARKIEPPLLIPTSPKGCIPSPSVAGSPQTPEGSCQEV